MSELSPKASVQAASETPHWTARHGKPIIFLILTLVAVGVYLAVSIPGRSFSQHGFSTYCGWR